MASSQTLHSPLSLSLSSKPSLSPQIQPCSVSFRCPPSSNILAFKKPLFSIRSASIEAPPVAQGLVPAITLTETALKQLNIMRLEKNKHLCVRIGAERSGYCSGNLSYTIVFEERESSRLDDCAIEYDGFVIVCDPESLIILGSAQLDYDDDAPFGRGFSFKNVPNNTSRACGCCKSLCCRDVNAS